MTAILAADMRTKGEPRHVERPAFLTCPAAAAGERDAGIKHAINVLRQTSQP